MMDYIKEVIELIATAYWSDHEHCGADFDEASCYGTDTAQCVNFEFCKRYANLTESKKTG